MMLPTGAGCHGPQGMEADEGKSRGPEAGDRVGRKPFRLRAGPLAETGGILRLPALDSPASMSIQEESTIAVLGPMMGGRPIIFYSRGATCWQP